MAIPGCTMVFLLYGISRRKSCTYKDCGKISKLNLHQLYNEASPVGAQSGSHILTKSKFAMSGGGRGGGKGGGLVETNFQLLMLSPNLLKSQIPMCCGGGGVETNLQLLMLSPNLLKSKNIFTREFAENFLSFWAKKCLGMVLDFEYQMVRVYFVYANHNKVVLVRHTRQFLSSVVSASKNCRYVQ